MPSQLLPQLEDPPSHATRVDLDKIAWDNGYRLVFEQQTAALPRTTEAERLVIQRVGQDVFREALMKYWNGACPLTGITDPELLRASHIVPWAECDTDALRLDVYNGLLLSSLWDAAFDAGLISFSHDGAPIHVPEVRQEPEQPRERLSGRELMDRYLRHWTPLNETQPPTSWRSRPPGVAWEYV